MAFKGVYRVLNMSWGWMLSLLFLFPLIGFVFQFVLFFLSLAYDTVNSEFPIIILPLFGLIGVYLWWQWAISQRLIHLILKETSFPNGWFKRAFYFLIGMFTIVFISVIGFDFLNEMQITAPQWVHGIISIVVILLMMMTIAAYVYCAYFTSVVLNYLFNYKQLKREFPYNFPTFMFVCVFPIGIPLLNKQIKLL